PLYVIHAYGRVSRLPVPHHRRVVTLDDFANAADAIAGTTSKREKVRVLADFLRRCDEEELPLVTRYFSGSVFAAGDPRTLNVGGAVFSRVLRDLGGAGDAA